GLGTGDRPGGQYLAVTALAAGENISPASSVTTERLSGRHAGAFWNAFSSSMNREAFKTVRPTCSSPPTALSRVTLVQHQEQCRGAWLDHGGPPEPWRLL